MIEYLKEFLESVSPLLHGLKVNADRSGNLQNRKCFHSLKAAGYLSVKLTV